MNVIEAIRATEDIQGYQKVLELFSSGETRDHTMAEWTKSIGIWAVGKGWNDKERPFDEWIALFHSELSEAYEEYRNNHDVLETYFLNDSNGVPKPEGIGVELADLLIRIFHFADFYGMDLNELVNLKMGYNNTRSYRHGGKKS